MNADKRWMGAALALSERTRGRTAPNPNAGCVIVKDGRVVGRGWTAPGGRPHAEAVALRAAGEAANGATAYVTLEPCAHDSARGPACADLLIAASVARVVIALRDPDPRTDGRGAAKLEAAGIDVMMGVREADALHAMAGFVTRQAHGRPRVTLKLALSLDGKIARADGTSRWITGEAARRHAHLERARHEAIVVGRGTWEADQPALDVRLAGLEDQSPAKFILTTSLRHPREGGDPYPVTSPLMDPRLRGDDEWRIVTSPEHVATLPGDHVLVEGGARAASAFLAADLVDRLLLYRAPILIGDGNTLGDIGLTDLADAHGRWNLADARQLGSDRLEVYDRTRCSPA